MLPEGTTSMKRHKTNHAGRTIAVLGLLLAAAWPAAAADKLSLRPGMGGVPDIGALECATFNEIHPWGPIGFRQSLLTWAGGYMHGQSGQTLDEILAVAPPAPRPWTFDTLTDHMVDYCRRNPGAGVAQAVNDLWLRLKPQAP